MNGANGRVHDSPHRINSFSLEKLNQVRDRLINAKISAGVDVPINALSALSEMIRLKEREKLRI